MFMTIVSKIRKYFKVEERKTTIMTEVRSGVITFLTMAYILSVNAAILSNTGGTCPAPIDPFNLTIEEINCRNDFKFDIVYATAISAGTSSLAMGLFANLPFGLAPGMGLNAFFAFDIVLGKGISYQNALFATFIEGAIFLVISATGIRTTIMKYIPSYIKLSMGAGIGLFLAHIGLQSAEGIGLVTGNGATLVTLGGCDLDKQVCNAFGGYCECPSETSMEGATTWLGIAGFGLLSILIAYRIKGAIFITIMLVSFLSWFRNTSFTYFPDTIQGNLRYDNFKDIVDVHSFKDTPGALFDDIKLNSWDIWYALITFLYVDFLDTSGSLFAMAELAGLLDEEGSFPGQNTAFCIDAIGTMLGSLLGTSTVTTYIESGSGIKEGGRTGITAIIIAILFFLGLLFAPIFTSIPPWAIGPALIIIGSFMVKSIEKINWDDPRVAIPSFITIIIMPLTYSIAYGVIGGIGSHIILKGSDYIITFTKNKLFDKKPIELPNKNNDIENNNIENNNIENNNIENNN